MLIMVVFSRNFLQCLQLDVSSFLLLSVDISGLHIKKYFSHRHKLHFLLTFEYDLACFTFRHFMSHLMSWSFRIHMYLLSLVAC